MTGKTCDKCILIHNRILSWRRTVNKRSIDVARYPTPNNQTLYNNARVELAKWRNEKRQHEWIDH